MEMKWNWFIYDVMKTLIIILLFLSCTPQQGSYNFTPIENEHKTFTAQVVEEINLHRKTPLKESDNQLAFYLAHKHSQRGIVDHYGYEQRQQVIKDNTHFVSVVEIVGYGFDCPERLVFAWKNSERHRAVLMRDFKEVSIARHELFVTALFLK